LRGARDGDMARAGDLARAYANLQRELTQHHEGEDQFVFPFLASVGGDADVLKAMDDEHHAMAEALAETRRTGLRARDDPATCHVTARQDCRPRLPPGHRPHVEALTPPPILELWLA
jgi:hypothetical protein